MKTTRIEHTSKIPAPAASLWKFHMRSEALEILTPWWMGLKIVDFGDGVANGSLVRARFGRWPLRMQWDALHANVDPGRGFTDVALRSPFPYWIHHHEMEELSEGQSLLRDTVWVRTPAWLPSTLVRPLLRLGFAILFKWRHRQIRRALATDNNNERERSIVAALEA